MIIGICGKSGSGKTTLANKILEILGNTAHLDIDKVGHDVLLLDEVKKDLITNFSSKIIKNDIVDRKSLSAIVFNSPKKMDLLTDITWKHMQIIINKFLNDNKDKNIILDWQLLPKTDYFNICNHTILLDIPYEIRLSRTIKRDNISEKEFQTRENASLNPDPNRFTYILKNDKDINNYLNNLKQLL